MEKTISICLQTQSHLSLRFAHNALIGTFRSVWIETESLFYRGRDRAYPRIGKAESTRRRSYTPSVSRWKQRIGSGLKDKYPLGLAQTSFNSRSFSTSSVQLDQSREIRPDRPRIVLGLESSADDSCCAIVDGDRRIWSNVVLKQHEQNAVFGGIHSLFAQKLHQRNVVSRVRPWVFGELP